MNEIQFAIILALEFLGGFILGRLTQTSPEVGDLKKKLEKALDRTPVGAVRRPDAKQLLKWKDPKAFEAEEAMVESLKKIPELNR